MAYPPSWEAGHQEEGASEGVDVAGIFPAVEKEGPGVVGEVLRRACPGREGRSLVVVAEQTEAYEVAGRKKRTGNWAR